ncbi:hypothetical protein WDW37_10790 [Bdellovibrionota bacterium FG-1]
MANDLKIPPKKPGDPFTVDNDESEMIDVPSVTRLLNRKKLSVSDNYKQQPALALDTLPPPTREIELPPPTLLRIQLAKPRNNRKTAPSLIAWKVEQLKAGPDPLGKGLALALDRGATCALFLSITTPPAGSPVPHFIGTAALAPPQKTELWSGLKWDPMLVPELWNHFVRAGFVELSPPSANTYIKSNRNVVRAAFGIDPQEWLLLVRAGPPTDCRGVLALVSETSIITELTSALALIGSPIPAANFSKKPVA